MIILDKISKGAHYVNFLHASDLTNGEMIEIGSLDADGESFAATAVTAVTGNEYAINATVPLDYISENTLDFTLTAGEEGRGVILQKGDIVTVSDDKINGATTVDQYVELEVSANGLAAVADPTLNNTDVQFRVINKETKFGIECSVLLVIKA